MNQIAWKLMFVLSGCIAFLVVPGGSHAHQGRAAHTPPPPPIVKQISEAELIVIADVTGRGEASSDGGWSFGRTSLLRVVKTLKGVAVPNELEMVTTSVGAWYEPNCCDVGKRYLLLLSKGYPNLTVPEGGEVPAIVLKESGAYVSSSHGAYGAYPIQGGRVIDWPEGATDGEELRVVESFILEEVCRTER